MPSNEYFRAGVGIVVVDRDGRVLALERCDVPGTWQLPQGGMDPGEVPLDAARRELAEETGIEWDSVELLAEHPTWLGYELPESSRSSRTGRGQVHRWFLVRFEGDVQKIDLNACAGDSEFRDCRWMPIGELCALTWGVRQPIYQTLESYWSSHLA